jgi:hypothetical protein
MKRILLAACASFVICNGALAQQNGEAGGVEEKPKGPPPILVPVPDPKHFNPWEPYVHIAPLKLPNGMTEIIFWGGIERGDAERFDEAMQALQKVKPWNELYIEGSGGGDLDEGIEIGRLVRKYKLATRIPTNHSLDDPEGQCVSACNFVFLGGVIRKIDVGGIFETHLFHRDGVPEGMLEDVIASTPDDAPPVAQNDPSTGKPGETKSSLSEPPPSKFVLPIVKATPNFSHFGCDDIHRIYNDDVELDMQKMEVAHEQSVLKNKLVLPGTVDPEKTPPQNDTRLKELRALTIDYMCIEQKVALSAAEIVQFILEMRLSMRFFDTFANIPNAQPTPLTRNQLRDLNIINSD